jgi:hypothetical protein
MNLVAAAPELRLLDLRTVRVIGYHLAPPRVTPADVRAIAPLEVSDVVAEGVSVPRDGVFGGDEAVLDVQALVLEAEDGVFEVHEDACDSDVVICGGVVLDVDDDHVGAEGLDAWLGGLAGVGLSVVGGRDIIVLGRRVDGAGDLMVLDVGLFGRWMSVFYMPVCHIQRNLCAGLFAS